MIMTLDRLLFHSIVTRFVLPAAGILRMIQRMLPDEVDYVAEETG